MTFTSLPTALLAAAAAIPALLLLYFLKLRRHQRTVPSTLLWKKAVQDMQVNAPFQKLRKNLLLLLQLIVLLALLFALAGPVANFRKATGENVVILIDRSGSMNTRESDGRTRLDHAREAAADFLRGMKSDSRAMVIAFADRAEVACAFTNDVKRLTDRIDDIQPTDGPSRIAE
ncbi:MAG TPA: VWA domain-containing protein, partial [Phycisphaerae bacterium]|nr:VWA domain-containing protein [Phycisphaerae bacterium]